MSEFDERFTKWIDSTNGSFDLTQSHFEEICKLVDNNYIPLSTLKQVIEGMTPIRPRAHGSRNRMTDDEWHRNSPDDFGYNKALSDLLKRLEESL